MKIATFMLAAQALAASLLGGPRIDTPVLATIHPRTLTIPGSGFGAPGPRAAIVGRLGGQRVRIPSTSDAVVSWEDSKIVISTDQLQGGGAIRVHTRKGQSRLARVLIYRYDWLDIPPTPGTNALPLAIEADAEGGI
jgi:hypothetical protein